MGLPEPTEEVLAMRTNKGLHARAVCVLVSLGLLAGCVDGPPPVPDLTFVHSSPILLRVRVAEIDSRYRSPGTPPNIEQTVNPTPEQALIRWAQQRLRSDGTENVARFTILNAPLTAEPLPRPGGFAGLFASEAPQRWTVTVEAQLEFLDESGGRLDGFSSKVTRTRDLEPGLTFEERNRFWYDLLAATMREFDQQMDSGLRQHATRWMR
jgi:hypothetical protein